MSRRKKTLRDIDLIRLMEFREKLLEVYGRFREELEALCKEYGVKISFWYTPTRVPQPRFVIDGLQIDADELLDDSCFEAYFGTKRLRQMGFKPIRSREMLMRT